MEVSLDHTDPRVSYHYDFGLSLRLAAHTARNLKKILTGSLAVNGHNPLNEVKREWIKRVRTVLRQLTWLQGISATGQFCLQQLYVFGFSKLRVLPREASQAKGNEKGLSWNKSLGIF